MRYSDKIYLLILVITFFTACQQSAEKGSAPVDDAVKIARAYGFDSFDQITTITYTFNVDTGERHIERSWEWNPNTSKITYRGPLNGDSVITYTYYRDKLDTTDSRLKTVDQRFINDKYWLLFPFNLIWDDNVEITEEGKHIAPIDSTEKYKLTVQYDSTGGYTPGDAYDLYYDKEDYLIDEWVFRKGGGKQNARPFTWENNKKIGPLLIASDHFGPDRNFRLYFTDVEVKTK